MFFSQLSFSINHISSIISSITAREIVDIFLVALAVYFILIFVKQTRSYLVLSVALILIGVNIISQNFNLALTRQLFQPISTISVIILVIIFQREIRRFFRWVATNRSLVFLGNTTITRGVSEEIFDALNFMAKNKIGGLIVFPGEQPLEDIFEGGELLDGKVTKEVLLSIFDTSSPGHDGAVVIQNNRIKLFGVHLPLARDYTDFRKAGTRHRAAVGVTEDTDAITLVVSEERGIISLARNGILEELKEEGDLKNFLKEITLSNIDKTPRSFWNYFFVKNVGTKVLSILLASLFWIVLVFQAGVIKKEFEVPLSFQLLPENLVIDTQASKSIVNLTLQGSNQDFVNFDPTIIQAKVDAKSFSDGLQKVELSSQSFNVPAYLDIVNFTPKVLYVNVGNK